jgi:hypothetical protein
MIASNGIVLPKMEKFVSDGCIELGLRSRFQFYLHFHVTRIYGEELYEHVGSGRSTQVDKTSVTVSIGCMRGNDRCNLSCVTVYWTGHVIAG